MTVPSSSRSTTPNGELHLRDDDRRRGAALARARRGARRKSRSSSSSPLSASTGAAPRAARRRESARPPPRPSGSLSPTGSISAPRPASAFTEDVLLPGAAGDDDARHAGVDEPRDGVLREREAGDRDERLRQALRRLAEPLRLAARKEKRLHQLTGTRRRLRRPADRLVLEARGRDGGGIEEVAAVDDERTRHRLAHLVARETSRSSGHSVTIDGGVGAAHGVERRSRRAPRRADRRAARPDPSRAPPRPPAMQPRGDDAARRLADVVGVRLERQAPGRDGLPLSGSPNRFFKLQGRRTSSAARYMWIDRPAGAWKS